MFIALFFFSDDIPVVHYGKNSLMGFKAEGSSKTYKKSHMCGPPASTNGFTDPGYIHDVLLTDLSPSSHYFYSYGSSKVSGYWVKLNKEVHCKLLCPRVTVAGSGA